ncbi:ParB/RepB/Spo0J family partition protein [Streptomyces spinosisporus]|uniref:ParB/RepB/Spo0J family partition protein n=1 Tax=Streptomyces spinosisporus TaxID=2927582 RepID=A0ABS9XDC8_9ACTN|nr:ParB/RepB/Spo0J family partition protein [Streptomyces spinosisporus]MCI3240065.1 ParB/RepB/Spo0J family partition protein [Streptomyces spinosisporus]
MDHTSVPAQKSIQHPLHRPDPYLGGRLSEIIEVPISRIVVAGSLRTGGEDPQHINALAEVCSELPPIVIHRKTMTVIDGVHRLRAVENSGATHISAVLFNGDEREAFVLAVKLNSNHGLPLSLADRKAAALHMLADFPQWSNRRLAGVVGLSDKTVAALRRRSGAELPHPTAMRVGRDGVAYPLTAAEGRSRAQVYLAAHPDASAREVARAAGISLTTAKDARKQARALPAQPPPTVRPACEPACEPARQSEAGHPATEPDSGPMLDDASAARDGGAGRPAIVKRSRAHPACTDLSLAVRRLRADPSLRFTEVGRKLLRTLDPTAATQPHDWAAMANSLPMHCAPLIAELARHHAESWQLLAESLTERINARESGA